MLELSEKLFIKLRDQDKEHKLNIPLIEYAIDYIKNYHGTQTRHSGEPYYNHPLEVTYIVADFYIDTETLIAALLHDIVEDTEITLKQIELIFGKNVANIVDAVTKITMHYQLSKQETFDKIINSSFLENKSIVIKIIDRLHNMRTIKYIKSIEKQKRIAKETLEIYVPLAEKVKLHTIKQELKDSANKILNL
jgi:(p)ppGpp synthase/HD superfamily hydrolase